MFECLCECGNTTISGLSDLREGKTRSCGCSWKSAAAKRRDLIHEGMKFSKLMILREADPKYGRRAFECQCDCGRLITTTLNSLKRKNTTSCGCTRKENSGRPTEKEFVQGTKFGRLTLEKEVHVGKRRFVECLCDCGNRKTVFLHSVLRELTKSCGCIKKELRIEFREVQLLPGRIRGAIWRALRRKELGKIGGPTFKLLGYSKEEAYLHLSSFLNKPCLEQSSCNGIILNVENSHVDHIVPQHIANTLEEIVKINQLSNLRLICSPCNLKKHMSLKYVPKSGSREFLNPRDPRTIQ